MRAAVLCLLVACDSPQKPAVQEASTPTLTTPTTTTPKPPASVQMPPRPIPKPQNTVGSGTTEEVQMKTIAYMTAMSAAQPDDMPVDQSWVKNLTDQLGPITRAMDKGTPDAKARLGKVETIGGGRRIALYMAVGCDAQMPARAAQNASAPLSVLLQHGVLVIQCNDARYQCLQSTRDPEDVLCTTAPRH